MTDIMNSSIDIYDALIVAGAPEDKARAAASAIPEQSNVATKLDIVRLEGKIAELETRMTWKVIVIVSILNGVLFALLKFT